MFFERLWWECDRRSLLVGPGSSHHSLYLFNFIGWICWTTISSTTNIRLFSYLAGLGHIQQNSYTSDYNFKSCLQSRWIQQTAKSCVQRWWIWQTTMSFDQSNGFGRWLSLVFKAMDVADGNVSCSKRWVRQMAMSPGQCQWMRQTAKSRVQRW